MIGPPASGKGFFLERGKSVGRGLPESTKGLFTDDQIPHQKLGVEESDNNLRAIQYEESLSHFKQLSAAHKKGKKEFQKVLNDKWYKTKDGDVRKLSSFISFDTFDPSSHASYHTNEAKSFYVSLRGWHNDADEINPETGKIKERFKDEARKLFEKNVRRKISVDSKDMLIVDSAGEDIDSQDFEGQIAAGKAAGYEVTVIVLEPEKEESLLSNMFRGYISGKRMVDNQDIDNFYDKYKEQVEKIKKAAPHNFLAYKKKPLTPSEIKNIKSLMTHTPDGKETFLLDPNSKYRTVKDLPEDVSKKISKAVAKGLYAHDFELDTKSSFGATMKGLRSNPFFESNSSRSKSKSPESDKDSRWLDQRVINPETGNKVLIRTLRNKPKDSKGYAYYRHLLEKQQKLRTSKIVSKVAFKYLTSKVGLKMANLTIDEMKNQLLRSIKKQMPKIQDLYEVGYDTGSRYETSILITLKDAEGDTTTARKINQTLTPILKKELKKASDIAISCQISSFNSRGNLVLEITLVFPA